MTTEFVIRVDEAARRDSKAYDIKKELEAQTLFGGVEIVSERVLPEPVVQTFEVTITTPPLPLADRARSEVLTLALRRTYDPHRTIQVVETTRS